jgi:hypothetical protein
MKDLNGVAFVLVLGGVLLAVLAIGQEKRFEWEMKRSSQPGKAWLKLEVSRPGHHSSHSTDVPLERFRGLPSDAFRSGAATFEYVHDAGRLLCKGRFSWNRGSGTFTFEPNPQFSTELNRLGYETPDREQIFNMMMTDISLEFARGVKDAGLSPSTSRLIDLKNHGVSLEYIQKIRKLGHENLNAQDYIDMRNHGVKPEFMSDLKDAGYDLRPSQIIDLRNHGVNSDYLSDLKSFGLKPSASDLVRLRNHGVTPEYLLGLKEAGYHSLTADHIVDLKNHGVPTDFIRTAKELGYNFTPQELTEMRNHGVDAAYLRRLRDSGMKNLSASQISKLRQHGVN